jgi:hypothetical protein
VWPAYVGKTIFKPQRLNPLQPASAVGVAATSLMPARRRIALRASVSLVKAATTSRGAARRLALGVHARAQQNELTGRISHELVIREFHDRPLQEIRTTLN